MDLAEAVAARRAEPDERALAELRRQVADELEEAVARPGLPRARAAYRAIGQLRFTQKTELLRRGLEDESPACRGSALLSLELLSRDHPGPVNGCRPLLHTLANDDPNQAVRRLAVLCLKNGSPAQDTITLLDHSPTRTRRRTSARPPADRDSLRRRRVERKACRRSLRIAMRGRAMTVRDELLQANQRLRERLRQGRSADAARPALRDRDVHGRADRSREGVRAREGDAHVIRNAGGLVTTTRSARSSSPTGCSAPRSS